MALAINYSFIKGISRIWRWGIVTLYTLSIYAFLPYAPRFWRFVLGHWGDSVNYLGIFFVCVLGAYFLVHLIFQRQVKDFSVYLAFFLISIACLAILKYMCVTGAERFHLLLYGTLTCFIFWAFKFDVKRRRVYLYTAALAMLLGAIDEGIQYVLPMRVFDVRDIYMNWLSSGMGELFIIFVLKPDVLI